ncbi:MAG: hypothetical protein JNL21_40200 [Myxococcales bacterium]|nr:hypothetical protein [Myxococcales bacterium]
MSPAFPEIERLAVLLAHLEHFDAVAPARVLERFGETPSSLSALLDSVLHRLSDPAGAGALTRTSKTTKADLAAKQPRLEDVGTAVGAPASELTGDEETASASARPASAALPFRPAEPGRVTVLAAPPMSAAEQSGDTVGLDQEFAAGASTPFEEARLRAWTVEKYAAFIADRRTAPADWVVATYGAMTEGDEVALLVHFNKRFRQDPALRDRWEVLVAERARRSRGQ